MKFNVSKSCSMPSAATQTTLKERDGLYAGDLKWPAASRIDAGNLVVATHHVALRFGELGAVALIGAARHLAFLAAHQPLQLILARLAAVRAGKRVLARLRPLVKEVAFVHRSIVRLFFKLKMQLSPSQRGAKNCAILAAMAATKKSRSRKQVFSVTKAVKANARARVGQPKPERVLPDDTKTARATRKHKTSLQQLIQQESE
jgi:hypothetical protein